MTSARRVRKQGTDAIQLFACLGPLADAEAEFLQAEEVLTQLCGGALGRSAGIVQLMHEPGSERAQRHQLLAMQSLHLVCLHAFIHVPYYDPAHCGATREQVPELILAEAHDLGVFHRADEETRLFLPVQQWSLAKTLAWMRESDGGQRAVLFQPVGTEIAVENHRVIQRRLARLGDGGACPGTHALHQSLAGE